MFLFLDSYDIKLTAQLNHRGPRETVVEFLLPSNSIGEKSTAIRRCMLCLTCDRDSQKFLRTI